MLEQAGQITERTLAIIELGFVLDQFASQVRNRIVKGPLVVVNGRMVERQVERIDLRACG